jgi:hypothetical protein
VTWVASRLSEYTPPVCSLSIPRGISTDSRRRLQCTITDRTPVDQPLQTVALSEPCGEFHNGRALAREGGPAPPFVEGGVPRHGGSPASSGFHRPSAMWLPPSCGPTPRLAASRLPLQACPVGRRQRRPSSPLRRGRALTSPSRQSMSNATARATANTSGQRSTSATCPAISIRSFETPATIPAPRAISRRRSPGGRFTY